MELPQLKNSITIIFIIVLIFLFVYVYIIDQTDEKFTSLKKEKEIKKPTFGGMIVNCINGVCRGFLTGLITTGHIEGAVTSGIIMGVINPISSIVEIKNKN